MILHAYDAHAVVASDGDGVSQPALGAFGIHLAERVVVAVVAAADRCCYSTDPVPAAAASREVMLDVAAYAADGAVVHWADEQLDHERGRCHGGPQLVTPGRLAVQLVQLPQRPPLQHLQHETVPMMHPHPCSCAGSVTPRGVLHYRCCCHFHHPCLWYQRHAACQVLLSVAVVVTVAAADPHP